jgi:hypothetical protein
MKWKRDGARTHTHTHIHTHTTFPYQYAWSLPKQLLVALFVWLPVQASILCCRRKSRWTEKKTDDDCDNNSNKIIHQWTRWQARILMVVQQHSTWTYLCLVKGNNKTTLPRRSNRWPKINSVIVYPEDLPSLIPKFVTGCDNEPQLPTLLPATYLPNIQPDAGAHIPFSFF